MITVCFDVDGTLLNFMSDQPRYDIIALFHAFQKRGCRMHIWSHKGVDHARETAQKLGLNATIVEKFSFKPDIAVDDEERHLGRVTIPA